jgi:hypothetical protein
VGSGEKAGELECWQTGKLETSSSRKPGCGQRYILTFVTRRSPCSLFAGGFQKVVMGRREAARGVASVRVDTFRWLCAR